MNASISSPRTRNSDGSLSVKAGKSNHSSIQKSLLICGIFSSLLYVAMNILAAIFYKGYSSAAQTVSELSAIGAPTRPLWVALGIFYTLLVIGFAWGIWQSALGNKSLRIVGALLMAYGIIGLAWPFAPMHQREVLAAGGATLSDTMHIAFSLVTIPLMLLSIAFGAAAFGRKFRLYSITTLVILVIFGVLTGIDGPKISANQPTPWIGVWERILIGVFLLWVISLAIVQLRNNRPPLVR